MASIRLENLCKQYDNGQIAVRQANLEINDGEFLVLVGPSGCGKSTLLRMIAGLESITEGSVFIDDRCVNELSPGKRDLAMVFQNYALYPHMTVRENLSFGLRMRRTAKNEIQDRVQQAAEILSIESLLDRRPKELSGGQRQRVAVGRAIVRKPVAFLFDEPLSNLDARLRVQMRKELAELHFRLKTTTIYVTHDQVEAMTLGDRIVVMNEGEIQQIASPIEVYESPANRFVASFIGSPAMNLIDGTIESINGSPVFSSSDFRWPMTGLDSEFDNERSAPATFGFRPEHVSLNAEDAVLAEVKAGLIERLGDETMVYFQLGAQACTARFSGNVSINRGDSLTLHLPADRRFLFTGQSPFPRVHPGKV